MQEQKPHLRGFSRCVGLLSRIPEWCGIEGSVMEGWDRNGAENGESKIFTRKATVLIVSRTSPAFPCAHRMQAS